MKALAKNCPIPNCPGVYDPEDGSGDLIVVGRSAVFSDAYLNSDIAPGTDEIALSISRDLLTAAILKDEMKAAREIVAGFILWHDPAYKPSPGESLEKLLAEARRFMNPENPEQLP